MSWPESSTRTLSAPLDRRFLVLVTALAAVAVAIIFAVGIGPVYIGPADVVDSLLGKTEGTSRIIVRDIRLPRVIVGAMVGASLATSGAILQGVTRNPLADPHIFGISAGAGVVSVAGLVIFPQLPFYAIQPLAFLGGVTAGGFAYVMAWRGGVTPARLALAGIAVTSMLTALTSAILVTSSFSAQIGLRWLIGGLLGRNWEDVRLLVPYFFVGLTLAVLMSRQLNVISLGDEIATGLGQRVERMRLALTAVAALLASAAVSIAGLVGFLGLIVPHFARLVLGTDYRFIVPASAIFGALLLIVADTAARTVFDPRELPVGVLTATIGGPVFIYLIRKRA